MISPAGDTSSDSPAGTEKDSRPPVFMMIESLETGGSERQFAALARALNPRSFRLLLGCIRRGGPFLEGLGDVPQFPLGGSLYGLQSLRTRFHLARHLRRNSVRIAHSFDFYSNLTMIPAARLAGVPVVIGIQRQLGELLSPAQYLTQLQMFRWCNMVVCNSEAAAARLIEDGLPQRKVTVIGNGLPPSAFSKASAALPGVPGMLRVGMIARMNAAYKNHRCFLQAAARLVKKVQGVEFVLIGDGPLRPEFERMAAELGIRERVQFLGDRRDIPAVLGAMDVTVLPSDSESLSNVVLESMAAGVPVVASAVGGNIELLSGDRGVLVPRNDDAELAAALERLLLNPELRAKLADEAKNFVQANYGMKHVQESYEALYREQLARKNVGPA